MPQEASIVLTGLNKTFLSRAPNTGNIIHRIHQYLRPTLQELKAVKDISFHIQKGERVAFIGPNGAGKSTTIKMMTGILYPTSGAISVLGLTPWKDRNQLAYRIGTVFGQRSQLWYHLPVGATLDLLAKIYSLPEKTYRQRRQDLTERFGLQRFMDRPVKQLSLGERMRCEIVASLLHKPEVLFLDEPTIGLDINAKSAIRDLIKEMGQVDGTTIFLTSHDTGDVESVCDRVLVVNNGELLLDEQMADLKQKFIDKKIVKIITDSPFVADHALNPYLLTRETHGMTFGINPQQIPLDRMISQLMQTYQIKDLSIEDPPMEDIIRKIYQKFEPAVVP